LDARLGVIKRINQKWSGLHNAIKISGTLGLYDTSDNETVEDLRGVIKEMAAIKSGLWKTYYNGDQFTVKDMTAPTKKLLNGYKLRGF
jgi:hypothetical protein